LRLDRSIPFWPLLLLALLLALARGVSGCGSGCGGGSGGGSGSGVIVDVFIGKVLGVVPGAGDLGKSDLLREGRTRLGLVVVPPRHDRQVPEIEYT
jgi:hypothetical protein